MALDPIQQAKLNGLKAQRDHLLAAKTKLESSLVQNEPGVTSAFLPNQAELNQAGVDTAEAIGAKGHPLLGAAAGTAVQMAPDIALAAIPGGEAESIAKPLGKAADIAFAPSIKAGKEALGSAEVAKGLEALPFMAKDLPRNVSQAIDLSNAMDYISKQIPEEIAKVMEPEGINNLRKVLQYTMDNYLPKLPGANQQAIARAKDVLTKAIDIAEPSLAAPREALRNAYQRKDILSAVPKAIGLVGKAAKSSIVRGL